MPFPPPSPPQHIVDELISERAPTLSGSPLWPLLRGPLYKLLDYRKARWMADQVAPLSGAEALDFASDLLRLDLEVVGAERIPRTGRLMVVINHPTGLADAVAVLDALKPVRPDLIFFANADAMRVNPRMGEVVIPVEWVEAKRTRDRMRETLLATRQVLEAERCLVIFPSGRLSRRQPDGRLADPPWAQSAVSLARRYGCPVVPIHVAGPFSALFHFFNRFSGELRDVTLFHELLNKQGRRFVLTVGGAIPAAALEGEAGEVTLRLKVHVERGLADDPDRTFT